MYRPTFYAVIVLATVAGVALNLLHVDAISALFYTAVINGVVAPPLMILIALLGLDKKVMHKGLAVVSAPGWVWIATIGMARELALALQRLEGARRLPLRKSDPADRSPPEFWLSRSTVPAFLAPAVVVEVPAAVGGPAASRAAAASGSCRYSFGSGGLHPSSCG